MTQMSDYVAIVNDRGYDSNLNLSIESSVNAARQDIVNWRRWDFLKDLPTDTQSIATVVGQNYVDISSLTDLAYVDAVGFTLNGVGYDVDPLQLPDLRIYQRDIAWTGAPEYWATTNNAAPQKLYIVPSPDAIYDVRLDYIKKVVDLTGSTADVFPQQFQEAIIWGAIFRLAFRQRDINTAQLAKSWHEEQLTKIQAQELTGQRQESTQVRESGDWAKYTGR